MFKRFTRAIAVYAASFALGVNSVVQSIPVTLSGLPDGTDHHISPWAWSLGTALILLMLNGLDLRAGLRFRPIGATNV